MFIVFTTFFIIYFVNWCFKLSFNKSFRFVYRQGHEEAARPPIGGDAEPLDHLQSGVVLGGLHCAAGGRGAVGWDFWWFIYFIHLFLFVSERIYFIYLFLFIS